MANSPHDADAGRQHHAQDVSAGRVALALLALVGVWAYAVNLFGFAAFIYPLLGLVLAAFAFTLTLTRA
ncbi:MAG: hypothetical protein AB7E80_17525 [Hyphomicrobiaceae bacterium]